jgi:hypothetical protein
MQTPKALALLVTVLLDTLLFAQRDDVNKMKVMLARNETSMTVGRVRYDLVGIDHPTVSDPSTLLLRVTRRTTEGWGVRVYSSEGGVLMMTGEFSDETLTEADGLFTFYHPNGQVESTGQFHHGAKTGVWKRFTPQGKALSDRVYGEVELATDPIKECSATLSCRP